MKKPSNHPDTGAGVLFIAIGLFALWGGRELRVGTADAMGPGYFPTALALILVGLGLATLAQGWRGPAQELPRPAWRTVGGILFSVTAFAVLLQPLGLVLSTLGLVAGCRCAAGPSRTREVLLLGAALAAGAVVIFAHGLDVQLPVWPTWFTELAEGA
ncbi:tripartite tricarboxylate transporter TctB family protein [Caldimonas thermodepolymerans]|uniref:tripartite tricarboxylate transporter TctB family protein n=1 Tax=Caldimonas thermodepolymerans TaxID=215580 RepID=UPI0022369973|nr:tripartite tricarboxylate transporter TctB family protein [Caldimonas thermodepolymerans]UZG42683.1 tripartite tricarboxylate transporter TctB family protein [Caldimonas thermodepolymerans]